MQDDVDDDILRRLHIKIFFHGLDSEQEDCKNMTVTAKNFPGNFYFFWGGGISPGPFDQKSFDSLHSVNSYSSSLIR